MAAHNIEVNMANRLNMSQSSSYFVDSCRAFQGPRTVIAAGVLIERLRSSKNDDASCEGNPYGMCEELSSKIGDCLLGDWIDQAIQLSEIAVRGVIDRGNND
jgi:hypothetical protein